ncbi:MAG: CpsD/CapB family tyrosine-protein kinase [Oscillospiraceae bacterium]|nr:CpsD/CapB family tyrosine-protein kinase [Oscillospiraceae bacterium]
MAKIGSKRKPQAPTRDASTERAYLIGPKMNFAAAEAYKLLRTNLMFSFSGETEHRVVGLTSAFHGEGKSLTSINLAYTLAEAEKSVLLIDGDMRLSNVAKTLELSSKPGLSNLLVGLNSVNSAIQECSIPLKDGDELTFDVIVAGDVPPNPSELLGSNRMNILLDKLKERYDYIILDLPPRDGRGGRPGGVSYGGRAVCHRPQGQNHPQRPGGDHAAARAGGRPDFGLCVQRRVGV